MKIMYKLNTSANNNKKEKNVINRESKALKALITRAMQKVTGHIANL